MSLDAFDYKEPACPLCSGKEFYDYDPNAQQGSIPVAQVIAKIDDALNREEYGEAKRILYYWLEEAKQLRDLRGQLAVYSELMGLHRKNGEKEEALEAAQNGLQIIEALGVGHLVSTATVYINAATVYKTFDMARQAMPLYEKAEKIYRENLNENDALFGALYNNMGLALADLDRREDALASFEKALKVMTVSPERAPEAAITCLNIADLYFGDDDRVEELIQQAYDLLNEKTVKHDSYYAFVCKKCAPAFAAHGYFLMAKELETEAEKIYAGT
ncbi:MAG: tetratricopeptide repeat protein [Clostridia bacterium]|nr:tetratricopeptide repeat protein [Clostridia bacterium]